jgi:class 3 adenylate cyclase
VDPEIVETFLGRINDPMPFNSPDFFEVDTAFRAIMFTDMQDSTRMTTLYGDTKALHLLHIHNVITRNALRNNNGREVKHTGDGIMAIFVHAKDAVKCAGEIQAGHRDHLINQPNYPLNIRIGISAGEPIEENGDFFGKAVQEAARLCSEAPPGEILTSEVIRDLCQEELHMFEKIGDILLKGFNAPLAVFKVLQKSSQMTLNNPGGSQVLK